MAFLFSRPETVIAVWRTMKLYAFTRNRYATSSEPNSAQVMQTIEVPYAVQPERVSIGDWSLTPSTGRPTFVSSPSFPYPYPFGSISSTSRTSTIDINRPSPSPREVETIIRILAVTILRRYIRHAPRGREEQKSAGVIACAHE